MATEILVAMSQLAGLKPVALLYTPRGTDCTWCAADVEGDDWWVPNARGYATCPECGQIN